MGWELLGSESSALSWFLEETGKLRLGRFSLLENLGFLLARPSISLAICASCFSFWRTAMWTKRSSVSRTSRLVSRKFSSPMPPKT
jgi:hypothetical protein